MNKRILAIWLIKLANKIDPSIFGQIEWYIRRSNNHNWIAQTEWNDLGKERHVRGQLRNRSRAALITARDLLRELT